MSNGNNTTAGSPAIYTPMGDSRVTEAIRKIEEAVAMSPEGNGRVTMKAYQQHGRVYVQVYCNFVFQLER